MHEYRVPIEHNYYATINYMSHYPWGWEIGRGESTDAWEISDITTSYYNSSSSSFVVLTEDSSLDRLLDANSNDLDYDATNLLLSLVG